MVYTINKPVIIRKYFGTADSYTYKKYTVAYKYLDNTATLHTNWQNIYYGKAFVDGTGYAEIDITDVVRNYACRPGYEYQPSTQRWIPSNFFDMSGLNNGFHPIESGNEWRTTYFKIFETTTETWTETIEVTNLFFPEYYADEENKNPYNSTCRDINASVNRSGILPHIPFLNTEEYYIDLEGILGMDGISSNFTNIPLNSSNIGTSSILWYNGYGNYSNSINLAQFFASFTMPSDIDFINGGSANFVIDEIQGGGAGSNYPLIYGYGAELQYQYSDDVILAGVHKLVAVDMCPAKYYISWITPFGEWQSQPLAAVTVNEGSANLDIQNSRRTIYNIENRSAASFNCKTAKVTRDKYRLFATMQYAPYVLLYDTERDKGYFCTFDTTNVNVKYKVKNPETFDFTLKQIRTTIN